jgi:uncharacterized protein (UPF0297 family)
MNNNQQQNVIEMNNVSDTLVERGHRYGPFDGHAEITQDLKEVMASSGGWLRLSKAQREALEMIAHKIGRILNGDPNYIDSYRDIAGYATLVADLLVDTDGATDSSTSIVVRVDGKWHELQTGD